MSNFQKVTLHDALTTLADARAHGIINIENYAYSESRVALPQEWELEGELPACDLHDIAELFNEWMNNAGFKGAHTMRVELFPTIRKNNYVILDLDRIKNIIDSILKDCFSSAYTWGKDEEVYELAEKYLPLFSDEDRPTVEQIATLRELATQDAGCLPVHLAIVCAYGAWLRTAINDPKNV